MLVQRCYGESILGKKILELRLRWDSVLRLKAVASSWRIVWIGSTICKARGRRWKGLATHRASWSNSWKKTGINLTRQIGRITYAQPKSQGSFKGLKASGPSYFRDGGRDLWLREDPWRWYACQMDRQGQMGYLQARSHYRVFYGPPRPWWREQIRR